MVSFKVLVIMVLLAVSAAALARIPQQGAGGPVGGGGPVAPCGSGIIDLTTGCTQPMLGGL